MCQKHCQFRVFIPANSTLTGKCLNLLEDVLFYLIHNGGICLEVFNKSTVVNSFDSQAWKQLYFATRLFACSGEMKFVWADIFFAVFLI